MLILIVKLKQKTAEIHTSPTYHGFTFFLIKRVWESCLLLSEDCRIAFPPCPSARWWSLPLPVTGQCLLEMPSGALGLFSSYSSLSWWHLLASSWGFSATLPNVNRYLFLYISVLSPTDAVISLKHLSLRLEHNFRNLSGTFLLCDLADFLTAKYLIYKGIHCSMVLQVCEWAHWELNVHLTL